MNYLSGFVQFDEISYSNRQNFIFFPQFNNGEMTQRNGSNRCATIFSSLYKNRYFKLFFSLVYLRTINKNLEKIRCEKFSNYY